MENSFVLTGSPFPATKTFVTELVPNHDFQSKRLSGKTCELCRQNISMFQSGLQCDGCNFIVHKTCLSTATDFPKECRIRSDILIWSHANQPNPVLRSSGLSESPTSISLRGIARPKMTIVSEFARDDHVMHVGFSKLDRSFIAVNDCGMAVEVNIEMYFSDEEIIVSPLPSPINTKRVLQVCTGAAHTMLLLQTGHVYAWGSNAKGQLGVGANIGHCSLPCLLYTFYDKGQIIEQIATGGYHSVAVSYHNQVYTWGLGENGRLGHGNESTEYLPKVVSTLSMGNMVVSRMACGWEHSLILVSRKLSAFEVEKNNNEGTPKAPGNKISLSVSSNVSNDNTTLVSEVYTFGKGEFGQCGHGSFDDCSTPKAVETLKNSHVVEIDGGFNHSVCLTGTGEVYCWGFGGEGQCGNGEKRNLNVPFQVELPAECTSIYSGSFHNMAVTRGNEIFVWGRLGNNQNHLRPSLIDAISNRTIIQAACGMLATVLVTVENPDTPPSSTIPNSMASLPYPQRIRMTKLMELSWNQLLQLQITDEYFYTKGGANYKVVKRRVRKGVPPSCRKRVWLSLSGGLQLMAKDPYLYWTAMKAIFARRTLLKSYDDNGVSKLIDVNLILTPSKSKPKKETPSTHTNTPKDQNANDNNQNDQTDQKKEHPLQLDGAEAVRPQRSPSLRTQLTHITEESIDSYLDADKEKYFKLVFDYSHKEQGHQVGKVDETDPLAQLVVEESEFTVKYELLQNFIIDDFVFDSHKLNDRDVERAKRILWILYKKDASDFAFLQVTLPALVSGLLHFLSEDQVYFCVHSLVNKHHFQQYRKIDPSLYTWVLLLLLKKECPDLFAHISTFIAEEMMSEEHFANSWHNGFFVGKLQYKFVMTIIDQFMVQGYKVLYRLGVALFMHNAPDLFKCSSKYQLFDALDNAMKNYDDVLFNELLSISYSLDVSHTIIWNSFLSCRDSVLPTFQKSTIVNWEQFATIWMWLPARYKLCAPKKLFCSSQDGFNLNSLINKCGYNVPTLLIVKSESQRCFGAFISCEWDRSTDYRGNGEMFVFTLMPEPKKFPWTRENSNFMRVDNKCLMIGGGGAGCALWLDDELYRGWSVHSATFDNDPLNIDKDFQCVEVEVFALIET